MTTTTAARIIAEAARQGFTPIGGRVRYPSDPALVIIELWDAGTRGCVELVPVADLVPLGIHYPFLATE